MLTHPCTYLIEKDCTLKYLENKKCQVFFSQDETEKDLLSTINLSLTFFSVYRQRQTVWLDKWQAPICGWDEGMAYDHEPIARKQLANNVRLLVA